MCLVTHFKLNSTYWNIVEKEVILAFFETQKSNKIKT